MSEFKKKLTAAEKELSLEILDDLSMDSLLGGDDPKASCPVIPKGDNTCNLLLNPDCYYKGMTCVFIDNCPPPSKNGCFDDPPVKGLLACDVFTD